MNRKERRKNKIPSDKSAAKKVAQVQKKYAVTFAGANPDMLSRKERSIILAMISQVPFSVSIVDQNPMPSDESDAPFSFDAMHVHVVFDDEKRVCLRWKEADIPGVFEGTCETL